MEEPVSNDVGGVKRPSSSDDAVVAGGVDATPMSKNNKKKKIDHAAVFDKDDGKYEASKTNHEDTDDPAAEVFRDRTVVRKLICFVGGSCQELVTLRQVNILFKDMVDTSLHWIDPMEVQENRKHQGVVRNILKHHDIDLYPGWGKVEPEHFNLNLKSLSFIEKCREGGIFEKKPVPDHDPDVPFSVSRALKIFEILDTYPELKNQWEVHSTTGKSNVVEGVIAYLTSVMLLPRTNAIDEMEHLRIIHITERKYAFNPIYNNYRMEIGSNFDLLPHQEIREALFNSLPYPLKCLVAPNNRYIRC